MRSWKPHGGKVRVLAFSPDGKTLVTAGGTSMNLWMWDPLTGAPKGKLEGHGLYPIDAAFSPDGQRFASISNGGVVLIREFGPDRAGSPAELTSPLTSRHRLAFAPDGRLVVASPRGFTWWNDPLPAARGSEPPNGTHERPWGNAVEVVRFTPDNAHLLVATAYLEIWTGDLSKQLHVIPREPTLTARALAVSPDSALAAVSFRHTVYVYRLSDRQEVQRLWWGQKIVHALAFTPDGRALLTAGGDGQVRVWDVQSWKETRRFDWGLGKISAVAFAPDGLTAAAGSEKGQIVVWDLDV
jgi:WD40 repeat protein